mgnify:CR=1 FL=1
MSEYKCLESINSLYVEQTELGYNAIPCCAFKNKEGIQQMLVICTLVLWKVTVQCHRGIALPLPFASLIESMMS